MADKKIAGNARRRRVPFVLKALALCVLAFIALLILLPAPPETDAGGVTTVARYVPTLRDTVDPIANNVPPVVSNFPRAVTRSVSPSVPPAPQAPVTVPAPVAVNIPAPAPEPRAQDAAPAPPSDPAPSPEPEIVAPDTPPPPAPVRKPGAVTSSEPATTPEQDERKPKLPWRIPGETETAALPPESAPAPAPETSGGGGLPSASAIDSWVKSQAWEFLGGVDAQGNILYRFEVWLEAPPDALKKVKSVAYEYDAPSATPKSRETDRIEGGFRVRFGSLACAKEITITLTMTDGQKQRAKVDGCRVLN